MSATYGWHRPGAIRPRDLRSTEKGSDGDRQDRSGRGGHRARRRLPHERSAEVEGRASLLLLPQQRRRHARAAGGGRQGLRHRHVARRHARLPEAAGEVGSEQGARRLRRQAAGARAVRERARGGRASRQGREHRSRSGGQAAGRRSEGRRLVDARSVAEHRLAGHLRHDHRDVVGAHDADLVGHAARQLHHRRRPIAGFAASRRRT